MPTISAPELQTRVRALLPETAAIAEIVAGLGAALADGEGRSLPMSPSVTETGVWYAWHDEDGPAVEFVAKVLVQLGVAWFTAPLLGPAAFAFAAPTIQDTAFFLMKLARSRVRLDDPESIAVLMALRSAPAGGWTVDELLRKLKAEARQGAPATAKRVRDTLKRLLKADAKVGPRPLVVDLGGRWRGLV